MKNLLFIFVSLLLIRCTKQYKDKPINSYYSVRIIDSCEYISVNNVDIKAYKGNCKFCTIRHKQELENLIKQLKDK